MSSEKSHRLYVKARHVSYQRGKRNTNPNVSLLALEGVDSTQDAQWYLGKRVAYVYRVASSKDEGPRVIWGKIRRTHGNSGVVRASFQNNLPPKSFGASLRVMMYPSSI
ncbi:60S ribosomal protein L33A [Alternaria hordeiaustralica]|uniref:60S ribosomal protein L33A n=1 Tax=Alternaria hordeiaustralica TaxID=1187925 RepID=UPI0020C4E27F|nr:60S ribosomal protein L33A [Alternaria hordeiaustralica]KAI4695154.1 60S ribosomal protein L33A [Alternaria hordeiaustralica]